MSTCYDISYRNMWPSDALNSRVAEGYAHVLRMGPFATACRAWFERFSNGNGLMLKVELATPLGPIVAERALKTAKTHEQVCAAIDGVFAELSKRLPRPAVAA